MWPFITDAPSAVQFIMLVVCTIMAVSHFVQPAMWVSFFTDLHSAGRRGLVAKTFMLELWPALLIVTLHQVWWGPGIVLTLYGWAQFAKVTIAMILPEVGLRSLKMAERGDRAFQLGGVLLLMVAASAGAALLWE